MVDVSKLSGGVKAAYIALVKCKASAALGLPAEAVKLFEEQYERKLQRARIADLELSASTDQVTTEVLAAIRAPFGQDDPKLPTAMQNLYSRIGAVRVAAFKEILAAHKWSWIPTGEGSLPASEADMDGLARAAFITLVTQKLAIPCGLPADAIQAFEQKYQVQLQRARIADLENTSTASDSVAREVLAAIRGPFGQDDAKLPMAMQTFFDRVDAVELASYNEIEAIHNWQWKNPSWDATTPLDTKIAAMDGLTRAALVALVTQKLAIPCGLAQETIQVFEHQYQSKLHLARVTDLESTKIEDQLALEVLSLVRSNFSGEKDLPRDMKTLTDKIDALKEMARKEILSAHDWSFAQETAMCDPCPNDLPDPIFQYHAMLPQDCLTVSAVYGPSGKVNQWKLRGREIHSYEPVQRIVYVRDVTDFSEWDPKVYRAFVLRLVADTAKGIASSPKERQYQEQICRDAIEDAKACDTRESNTPDEAWGDNVLAEEMLHGRRSRPYDDPFRRD